MAKLRLSRQRVAHGDLPPCCLRCGAPADLFRDRTFSWHPPGYDALLFFGPFFAGVPFVLGLVLILTQSKHLRMTVPLCQAHQHHWRWRKQVTWIGLAVPAVAALVGGASLLLLLSLPPQPRGEMPVGYVVPVLGAGVLFVLWVVTAVVLHNTAIRPTEITDRGITLTNVSPAFVRRVREQRGQENLPSRDDEEPEEIANPNDPDSRIRPPQKPWRDRDFYREE